MTQLAAKLSVSVPLELATAVRRRVASRGLSGFVAKAMAHDLERDQLGAFLTASSDWIQQKQGGLRRAAIQQTRGLNHNSTTLPRPSSKARRRR